VTAFEMDVENRNNPKTNAPTAVRIRGLLGMWRAHCSIPTGYAADQQNYRFDGARHSIDLTPRED
jgi:hypothetical protein